MGLFRTLLFGNDEEPSIFDRILNYGNRGNYGEYLTAYAVKNIPGYCKIYKNIYIPNKGKTSEIDILLIHEKGIFSFESKNYSGWIFGKESDVQWTQTLPGGHKTKFYNPIFQNKTHINVLKEYLHIYCNEIFYSYIIFSNKCSLMDVPESTDRTKIMHRFDMLTNLKETLTSIPIVFTHIEVDNLHKILLPLSNVSLIEKQRHINQIREFQYQQSIAPKCPRCGARMIKRMATKGVNAGKEFYGCSKYPNCKSIIKIE